MPYVRGVQQCFLNFAVWECPLSTQTGRCRRQQRVDAGVPLNLGALSERKRVLDVDAKIADRAFDLRVAQQDLDSPEVASLFVDQRCLGSTK